MQFCKGFCKGLIFSFILLLSKLAFWAYYSYSSLFSNQYRNTIARTLLGMHWNCKSLGTQFHPSGLRPLGWNFCPLGFAISMHPSKWSCNNIMFSVMLLRQFFLIFSGVKFLNIFKFWKTSIFWLDFWVGFSLCQLYQKCFRP